MKNQRTSRGLSSIVEFFRGAILHTYLLTLPRRLVPIPVPLRPRSVSGTTRRIPPRGLTGWLLLLVEFALLSAMSAWAGQPTLPAGVPDISDPAVRAHFQPVGVGNLRGNPDFPAVLLINTRGEQPPALFLGLDARNGKATWSLVTDPIILIVVFSEETAIQGVYVDIGFADLGKASGSFAAVDGVHSPALPDLLKAVTETLGRTNI